MRKIKFLVVSLLFCAISYAGYMGYERMTVSEAERFMQANVEALTRGESGTSIVTCLGLNNKPCTTSAGDRSTGPFVRVEL